MNWNMKSIGNLAAWLVTLSGLAILVYGIYFNNLADLLGIFLG